MDIHLPALLEMAMPFFHPVLMFVAFGLALYAMGLGLKVRKTRSATGEAKKDLVKGKYAQKHFQIGSIFLALMVFGAIGGMAVTYLTNGKLFVGPHLLAGLGITGLVALSAALAPMMRDGQKMWARNLHIVVNVGILGILGWQAATGVQIMQRIIASMIEPSALA